MEGLSAVLARSVAILSAEPRQERLNPTVLSRPLGSEAVGGLNPAPKKTPQQVIANQRCQSRRRLLVSLTRSVEGRME